MSALCSTNKHTSTQSTEFALIPKCYPIIFLCCSSFAFHCYLLSLSLSLSTEFSLFCALLLLQRNSLPLLCFGIASVPFFFNTHTARDRARDSHWITRRACQSYIYFRFILNRCWTLQADAYASIRMCCSHIFYDVTMFAPFCSI